MPRRRRTETSLLLWVVVKSGALLARHPTHSTHSSTPPTHPPLFTSFCFRSLLKLPNLSLTYLSTSGMKEWSQTLSLPHHLIKSSIASSLIFRVCLLYVRSDGCLVFTVLLLPPGPFTQNSGLTLGWDLKLTFKIKMNFALNNKTPQKLSSIHTGTS
jgi:hypothetical protein